MMLILTFDKSREYLSDENHLHPAAISERFKHPMSFYLSEISKKSRKTLRKSGMDTKDTTGKHEVRKCTLEDLTVRKRGIPSRETIEVSGGSQ
jgi:hypothetical protein